jgi:hypothetical protein
MIGNWDNSNCVFAVMPACLKLGSNPEQFDGPYFPIYRGPSAKAEYQAEMYKNPGTNVLPAIYRTGGYLDMYRTVANKASVIAVDYFPTMTNTNSITIECWCSIDYISTRATPFGFRTNSNNAFSIEIWKPLGEASPIPVLKYNYSVYLTLVGNSVSISRLAYKDGFRIGESTSSVMHMAYVKDSQRIRCYINGVLLDQIAFGTDSLYTGGTWTPSGRVNINTRWVTENYGHKGRYYNAIVYDTALSEDRIKQNFVLGPTLGGLLGFTSSNYTMILKAPGQESNSSSNTIGMPEGAFEYRTPDTRPGLSLNRKSVVMPNLIKSGLPYQGSVEQEDDSKNQVDTFQKRVENDMYGSPTGFAYKV